MKISYRKIIFAAFISLLFLGAVFFYQQGKFFDGKLHLVFCKVGQGDGIYIRTPKGVDIVIDGGPDKSILSCLSNHMPFWDRQIEVVILTHPHEDHFNGLIYVLNNYQVLSFYSENVQAKSPSYSLLQNLLAQKKIKPKPLFKGDNFIFKDKVELATVWPKASQILGQNDDIDANGYSIMQVLSFGSFDVLLTGDGSLKQELEFNKKIDILKVPHHGSKNNITKSSLEEINPKLAVITVGKNNYGHPAKSVLDMLNEAGIKTLRTDLDGEVEVVTNGNDWTIK